MPRSASCRTRSTIFGSTCTKAKAYFDSSQWIQPSRCDIEDECGGLREGDDQRIFEAFRQAGEDRSGFGLGLAIARQGIEAHAGALAVRNLPGQGCIFAVTLP